MMSERPQLPPPHVVEPAEPMTVDELVLLLGREDRTTKPTRSLNDELGPYTTEALARILRATLLAIDVAGRDQRRFSAKADQIVQILTGRIPNTSGGIRQAMQPYKPHKPRKRKGQ